MKKGDYRLIELVNAGAQQVQIYLNLTHKDAKMREMFGNKQFRQALSLGMNRKEIIELVYLGQSEPFQTGPRPGHPWFNEKLSRQFTQFDPKQANEILDKIGYAKRDGQNFRLRPDGQKVLFTTFTRNLAGDIEQNLKTLCGASTLAKLEVRNLDAWVHGFMRSQKLEHRIVYDLSLIHI